MIKQDISRLYIFFCINLFLTVWRNAVTPFFNWLMFGLLQILDVFVSVFLHFFNLFLSSAIVTIQMLISTTCVYRWLDFMLWCNDLRWKCQFNILVLFQNLLFKLFISFYLLEIFVKFLKNIRSCWFKVWTVIERFFGDSLRCERTP